LTQKITGRKQELTLGEWLWGLAWLGSLFMTVWILWKGLGSLPSFMSEPGFMNAVMIGYIVFVLSMGVLAAALFLAGIFSRTPRPWSHTFGLALLTWPLAPMALWWLLGIKLE